MRESYYSITVCQRSSFCPKNIRIFATKINQINWPVMFRQIGNNFWTKLWLIAQCVLYALANLFKEIFFLFLKGAIYLKRYDNFHVARSGVNMYGEAASTNAQNYFRFSLEQFASPYVTPMWPRHQISNSWRHSNYNVVLLTWPEEVCSVWNQNPPYTLKPKLEVLVIN